MSVEEPRSLPSVDRLAARLDAPPGLAVAAARRAIAARREEIAKGVAPGSDVVELARGELTHFRARSLRNVLNATGVIVHTNLGRAPLAEAARDAVARVAEGYSNLEFDLTAGGRGSRHRHISSLLAELTAAEDGIAVNNGAAAVLLAVAALAGPQGAVLVSRGELLEIGGGFRIPDVVAQAGARLIEVGSTNCTRAADYAAALAGVQDSERTVILRVHQSNFRAVGFVESVPIEDLCRLGAPVIDDIGSGSLVDSMPALADEPKARRSIKAGASLVCFSGDKLLGGPQAGLLVGLSVAVAAARRHPLARPLRIDKLSLAALAGTLSLYLDPARARTEVPVLAMLEASDDELSARAELMRSVIGDRAEVVRASALVGGGALPLLELAGPVVAIDPRPTAAWTFATCMRRGDPPVIGRLHGERLFLDPRTLTANEARLAAAQIVRLLND